MKFVFDEKKEIEQLMNTSTVDTSRFSNIINSLARYNIFVRKLSESDNIEIISQWMVAHCPKYNDRSYSPIVESYVKNAAKYPLKTIQNIKIYKSELDYIGNFADIKKEKVLFVLLCIAKYQKAFFGYQNGKYICTTPDVFKMARVNIPVTEREMMMHELYGPIGCSYRVDGTERYVTFISEEEQGDEIVFEMDETDYLELAFKYLWWKNGKTGYKKCKSCGRLFRMKNEGNQVYCKQCTPKYEKIEYISIKCADCGDEVWIDSKSTKTYRCEECQRKADYIKIGDQVKVCVNCKTEFIASSKSKTDLCKNCYEIYRRQRKTDVMNMLRKK